MDLDPTAAMRWDPHGERGVLRGAFPLLNIAVRWDRWLWDWRDGARLANVISVPAGLPLRGPHLRDADERSAAVLLTKEIFSLSFLTLFLHPNPPHPCPRLPQADRYVASQQPPAPHHAPPAPQRAAMLLPQQRLQ